MTRLRGWRLLSLVAMPAARLAPDGFAQGLQNGVITGAVRSNDGLLVPGVTVTVSSPSLQGTRSATSDINGNYVLRGLPPGQYAVAFELQGMAPKIQKTVVELGRTTSVDAEMAIAAVAESINVVAESSPVVSNTVVGANYTAAKINALPNGRTPQLVAELAPGLTDNTPNTEQVTISGGFAFDNVFLVDGVDVNDNIFGSPNNLYVEDAVEETQILTSGISAEYGRFSGGVVNVVIEEGFDGGQ
jgi:Carboxypeptidase regulatory-like domain